MEHEFTEVMGRIDLFGESIAGTAGYSPLDMFHYTAPGIHTYTGLTTNYFSVNGGVTALDIFNSDPGGDLGDWASSAGSDAYLAFSPPGQQNMVSQTDITVMNALGYSLAPIVVAGTRSEAIQGGAPVALMSEQPAITDSTSASLSSDTIKVTDGNGNPVPGDELYVNGVQVAMVTASWNASANTLTLTGVATVATYDMLLGEIAYQDTGSSRPTAPHQEQDRQSMCEPPDSCRAMCAALRCLELGNKRPHWVEHALPATSAKRRKAFSISQHLHFQDFLEPRWQFVFC